MVFILLVSLPVTTKASALSHRPRSYSKTEPFTTRLEHVRQYYGTTVSQYVRLFVVNFIRFSPLSSAVHRLRPRSAHVHVRRAASRPDVVRAQPRGGVRSESHDAHPRPAGARHAGHHVRIVLHAGRLPLVPAQPCVLTSPNHT